MKTTIPTLVAIAALASIAHAETITQTSDYIWDLNQANAPVRLDFNEFDTMGGTRLLTNVNVHVESFFSFEMITENGEDYAIGADEWYVEAAIFNNLTFNGLFIGGVGGTGFGPLSANLEASDGVEQSGADSAFWSFKDSLIGDYDALFFQLQSFEGTGTLEADIYPYLSLLLPPPPPYFDIWVSNHTHSGSVTLTYEYSTVPAPSVLAICALTGLTSARRRRN